MCGHDNVQQQKSDDIISTHHLTMTGCVYNCPFCSPPRCPSCGEPIQQAQPIWFLNPYTGPFYYVATTTVTEAA